MRRQRLRTWCVTCNEKPAAQRCMGVAHEAGVVWQDLLALVKSTDGDFEIGPLLQAITRELPSQHKYTRTAALRWISMLLEKCPEDMLSFIDELLTALLKALSDESDEVVKMNVRSAFAPFRFFRVGHGSDTVERVQLEVLGRICLNESHFLRVMNDIVRLFGTRWLHVGIRHHAGLIMHHSPQLQTGVCWKHEAALLCDDCVCCWTPSPSTSPSHRS